jgi:hypothetical protein
MGQALGAVGPGQAVARLLEVGAIRAEFVRITPELLARQDTGREEELLSYLITPFGSALLDFGAQQMGLQDESVRDLMERRLGTEEGRPTE